MTTETLDAPARRHRARPAAKHAGGRVAWRELARRARRDIAALLAPEPVNLRDAENLAAFEFWSQIARLGRLLAGNAEMFGRGRAGRRMATEIACRITDGLVAMKLNAALGGSCWEYPPAAGPRAASGGAR